MDEPTYVPEQYPAPAPPVWYWGPKPESLAVMARIAQAMLVVTIVVTGYAFLTYLHRAGLVADVRDDPTSVGLGQLRAADDDVRTGALLYLAAYLGTAGAFIPWFHRARHNAEIFNPSIPRWSPGWAIGSWFVPFLNLVRPYGIAKDIWASATLDPADPWPEHRSSAAIKVWWTLFVVQTFGGLTSRADPTTLDGLITRDRVDAAFQIVTILAAVAAIVVVRQITAADARRQASSIATAVRTHR